MSTSTTDLGCKVSLAMIVRNCAKSLDKCLESICEYVDDIVIVNTGINEKEEGFHETNAIAEKYGSRVFHMPWEHDFAKARNYSFKQCKYDVVMWLDSDDIVQFPNKLRENIDVVFGQEAGEALLVNYLYEFDSKSGECTCMHLRERIVDRRYWVWRGEIHEALCAVWSNRCGHVPDVGGRVIHAKKKGDEESAREKLKRNLKVFEETYKNGKEPGARHLYYWANTFLGLKDYAKALELYERYLEEANNNGEIYTALCACSEIYRIMFEQEKAKEYAQRAMSIFPSFPSAKLAMAEVMMATKDYEGALVMADQAEQYREEMMKELVCNPQYIKSRPDYIRFYCYAQLGNFEQAYDYIGRSERFYGNDDLWKAARDIVLSVVRTKSLVQASREVHDVISASRGEEGARRFLELLPDSVKEEPEIAVVAPKVRVKDKPTLSILTYITQDMWGPDSLDSGIGGSEEAVINMSREMSGRGWFVEVYAHTESRGSDSHGVRWYPCRAWGGDGQETDIAVFWRGPGMIREAGARFKGSYLWLHDIPDRGRWNRDTHEVYDKVIVLSKYHRDLHHWIPDEKIMLSANGLRPDHLPVKFKKPTDKIKLIWTSCPSRGLQYLALWWDELKSQFPNLELHVFYGWTSIFMEHKKYTKHHQHAYDVVQELRYKDGVVWHGMVGQKELNEFAATCHIWPYMCSFPEIYCISAIKLQACGVWPVVPGYASLPEVVRYGDVVKVEKGSYEIEEDLSVTDSTRISGHPTMEKEETQLKYVDALISRIKAGIPQDQIEKAKVYGASCTWSVVADQWDREFRSKLQCPTKVVQRGSFKGLPIISQESSQQPKSSTVFPSSPEMAVVR